jgi:hypothetical protein
MKNIYNIQLEVYDKIIEEEMKMCDQIDQQIDVPTQIKIHDQINQQMKIPHQIEHDILHYDFLIDVSSQIFKHLRN